MTTDNDAFLDAQAIVEITQRTAQLRATQRAWERSIMNARKRGITVRAIAEAAEVSPQTVLNIVARFTATDD